MVKQQPALQPQVVVENKQVSQLTLTALGKEPLSGRRLTLEPAAPCHAEFLAETYQLDDFMDRYRLAQDRSLSVDDIRKRLEAEKDYSAQQLRRVEWIIKYQDQSIGLGALADYQPAHNRAELLVGITDPKHRTSGLGVEATLLILEFAFHLAKLHKVIIFVYEHNKIAQDTALHLGFKQEALLEEHYFNQRKEQFIDLYQDRFLKHEFFNNQAIARYSKRLLNRDISLPKAELKTTPMTTDELNTNLKKLMSSISPSH